MNVFCLIVRLKISQQGLIMTPFGIYIYTKCATLELTINLCSNVFQCSKIKVKFRGTFFQADGVGSHNQQKIRNNE